MASATVTRIHNAIPSKGDDAPQSMARYMALPMLAMGLMIVAAGFVVGIVGGVNFGDFFAGVTGTPDFSDLGRGESLAQLTGAITFLGMGFILGGVVMSLVNIVRTLRDSGRDVQSALGASPLQLKKPLTGRLTPVVMMMGLMVVIAGFVLGIVAATSIGGVNPAAIADPASASTADAADIGTARALGAWLPGLRLVGIATLLTSVVLVLLTIQQVLRFQARRITELADTSTPPVTAKAS